MLFQSAEDVMHNAPNRAKMGRNLNSLIKPMIYKPLAIFFSIQNSSFANRVRPKLAHPS